MHLFIENNEIENIIWELIEVGIIFPNTNTYSYPVVIFFRKNGDCYMRLDFRALQNLIIKDKLPILIIDYLLDKIHGAQFFTKLHLHWNKDQIIMKEPYIPKKAFKIHGGDYEILVMPFGLCNTSYTFQSLMNHLLKSYIRSFVPIFFDDIIIYSKTLETHLQHVEKILYILEEKK